MFICPSLGLKEIENMTLQEINDRIDYHKKTFRRKECAKLKDFFNILTNTIAIGYSYAKTGKRELVKNWIKDLNNIFSDSDEKKEEEVDPEKELKKLKEIFG